MLDNIISFFSNLFNTKVEVAKFTNAELKDLEKLTKRQIAEKAMTVGIKLDTKYTKTKMLTYLKKENNKL